MLKTIIYDVVVGGVDDAGAPAEAGVIGEPGLRGSLRGVEEPSIGLPSIFCDEGGGPP